MSGYCNCACRDCFEIAIAAMGEDPAHTLCLECEEAGCSADGDAECEVEWMCEDEEEASHG